MLIDINSCFATIEQQANPHLRNKPLVVAAYQTPNGTILAASVDAKKLGIKTGMKVMDAKHIYPSLIVLPPDPKKYRYVHTKLHNLLLDYTNKIEPKSIDEFILDLEGYPCLRDKNITAVAKEIKERIKTEVGDYITVSIGIAPNRYLAKVAAGIIKPDGLVEINRDNYLNIYSSLKLTDLTGIKIGNTTRLNSVGIYTVLDFYKAPLWKLQIAFHSVMSHSWYLRLKGYEIDAIPWGRKSYGNEVALGKNLSNVSSLSPVLARLVDKMGTRLRTNGYKARGIHLSLFFKNGMYWHKSRLVKGHLFDVRDIFKSALNLLNEAKAKTPVKVISISCFSLIKDDSIQTELFRNVIKNEKLTRTIDEINTKWGDFTVGLGRGFEASSVVLDRIAFGGLK